jgi:hypothetical protein
MCFSPIHLVLVAVLIFVLFFGKSKESFYNIVPTENIDPEFRYPGIHEAEPVPFVTIPRQGPQLFERVGDSAGVDAGCNNVSAREIINWIHREEPRLMYDCVLKYDPSVELGNPYHTPRVLRLLLQNLPSYANLSKVYEKYLPVVRKCFPNDMRI